MRWSNSDGGGFAEQKMLAQRANVAILFDQVQIILSVANIAIENGTADLVVVDKQSFVDSALRISKHQRLRAGCRRKFARGEDVDAGHL